MLESILSHFTMPRKKDVDAQAKIPIASNRKARHHYEILEVFEAGLALKGAEVKSLRAGTVNFEGSFAAPERGELFLHNLHIGPYRHNTAEGLPPTRSRKLLMHRREIRKLDGRLTKGLTLIPLELYFLRGWAKVTLALAKGKRGPDKRDSLRRDQAARDLARSFKGKFKV
jgi:SsrA-binding protein